MTIEIHVEGREFSRAFFAPARLQRQIVGDVWGLLYRDGNGPWTFRFRIRTYVTLDPYDGQDHKTWMSVEFVKDEDEEASARAVAELLRGGFDVIKLDALQETVLSGLSHAEVQDKLLSEGYAHPTLTAKGGSA